MTPQEKAIEIISTYFDIISPIFNYDKYAKKFNAELFLQVENKCKEVAIIAVDLVVKQSMDNEYSEKYWQQVKEEINKL